MVKRKAKVSCHAIFQVKENNYRCFYKSTPMEFACFLRCVHEMTTRNKTFVRRSTHVQKDQRINVRRCNSSTGSARHFGTGKENHDSLRWIMHWTIHHREKKIQEYKWMINKNIDWVPSNSCTFNFRLRFFHLIILLYYTVDIFCLQSFLSKIKFQGFLLLLL